MATKEQAQHLADALVFGPLLIYSGLGKDAPKIIKTGMVLIGIGTVVYHVVKFFEKPEAQALEGMEWGPMHKASAEFHRPIQLVQQLHPRRGNR